MQLNCVINQIDFNTGTNVVILQNFIFCRCLSAENWQPNMLLDDGGDATHLMVKKFNSILKAGTFKVLLLTHFVNQHIGLM